MNQPSQPRCVYMQTLVDAHKEQYSGVDAHSLNSSRSKVAISDYIEGISRGTFCKPKSQQVYISLEHFVSLQPRECMFVKDKFMPDGIIASNRIYLWFPTPGKGDNIQREYAQVARNRIRELVAECPNFSEVIVDMRNNIGGILSTFIDALLPLFICDNSFMDKDGVYMYGINNKGNTEARFVIENNTHKICFSGDSSLDDELIPIEDTEKTVFAGKPIHVICNRYTMSSGEIICILMRKLGHKIYGENTRGLTNGCRITKSGNTKRALIPYYSISDGKINYPNGVKPDYDESKILSMLTTSMRL